MYATAFRSGATESAPPFAEVSDGQRWRNCRLVWRGRKA